MGRAALEKFFAQARVAPVLTAHPTEVHHAEAEADTDPTRDDDNALLALATDKHLDPTGDDEEEEALGSPSLSQKNNKA